MMFGFRRPCTPSRLYLGVYTARVMCDFFFLFFSFSLFFLLFFWWPIVWFYRDE